MSDRPWTAESVSALAQETVEAYELAGLAVGIVQHGDAVYAGGFGKQSIETGAAVTPDSMFRMASVTKPFVATAVMQLVEEDRVRLDAPVIDYLPYFRVDDRRSGQVTVRHLLNHTAGLPRSFQEPEANDDQERYIRRNAGVRLSAPPGERFGYSNLGYDILGAVISGVTGIGFEDYLETRVLTPVHMHTSTMHPDRVDARMEALPHLNGPHPILGPVAAQHVVHAPSSALIANAAEMCNWAIANLNRGRFGDTRILPAASYDELWSPPSDGFPVGLGWFVGEHRGHRTIQHGGSTTGYQTSVILAPDRATAVVILTNSYPVPKEVIALAFLDAVLGRTPDRPKPLILHRIFPTLIHDGRRAAITQYEALQAGNPDDYDFGAGQFYQIGWSNLLTALKRPRDAVEVIELAVAVHPDSDAYHHLLALAYNECDEKSDAIRCLQRCLELNPDHQGANDLLTTLRADSR